MKRFSLQPFFEKTIGSSIASVEREIALRLPQIADRLLEEAGRRLDQVLKQLELEQIVKEQVDNFPVERFHSYTIIPFEQAVFSLRSKSQRWLARLR